MKTNPDLNIELLEGRSYILGRQGHIYLDSPTASKQHAEISIRDGKVFLRDLNSRNGISVMKNTEKVKFESGLVELNQAIVIGKRTYIIKDLLSFVSDFVEGDDHTTRLEAPPWNKDKQADSQQDPALDLPPQIPE
jgi:pSer/pThr/pTyr-binding forkhead associated (FHA) protein